jgi:hypothetical protein
MNVGTLQAFHTTHLRMGIRFRSRCLWLYTILFILKTTPYESFVNAWLLSSPIIRIIPDHVESFARIRPCIRKYSLLQWVQRKPFCSAKANEETPVSVTSMKVRAMASFISMSILESLLASGIPMETILEGASGGGMNNSTAPAEHSVEDEPGRPEEVLLEQEIPTLEHQKEGDRRFALQDAFSPSSSSVSSTDASLEKEISTLLHKKEGDRILALQDGFAPEEEEKETDANPPLSFTATTVSEEDVIEKDEEEEEEEEDTPTATIATAGSPFSVHADTPHLIPPVPAAISMAFGRPLPVMRHAAATTSRVAVDADPYGE